MTSNMDNPISSIPILFASFLFLIMLMKIGKRSKAKGSVSNLPPGPWKLPFMGNLHQLVSSDLPQRVLRDLASKYGPLMHLKLGDISAIVVTSPDIAKEVLKTHDVIFGLRPPLLASVILSYNSTNIGFANGEYWRQVRKITTAEVMSAKRVKEFRPLREEEAGNLVKFIASNEGFPVNVSETIASTNFRITSRSAFGMESKDQERFISIVTEGVTLASGFDIEDMFPSKKWLHRLSSTRGKLETMHLDADKVLEDLLNEHKENRAKMSPSEREASQNLIDILLRFEESKENQFRLTADNIKSIIFDIYAAGSDTTGVTVVWALAEMMRNPKVLEKAQSEVRQTIGKRGKFEETSISEMHYLKQIIKETLRLHPPFPLLLPRECAETCEINGYEIPSMAKVVVNAWAIGRDPKHWTDPETFNPERFSNSSIDYKGNNFEYIPFGAGRRMCPGMYSAITSIELFLSMLLYHFDWKLPNGMKPTDLDMDEAFGLTARKKNDLYLVPTLHEAFSP